MYHLADRSDTERAPAPQGFTAKGGMPPDQSRSVYAGIQTGTFPAAAAQAWGE
jgi:hypothetical protein